MTGTAGEYITPKPTEKLISVTRGCDCVFTIQRVNTNGDPLNFSAGASMYLWIDIDKAAPTKVDVALADSTAEVIIVSGVCDQVRTGTRWRAVLKRGDRKTPIMVGKFERDDG